MGNKFMEDDELQKNIPNRRTLTARVVEFERTKQEGD